MPRWSSGTKRTLGKKTREFDHHEKDYRYPPKPDYYYDVKEKGQCRWCGSIIKPLYEQKNVPNHMIDWSYWDERNLQTLCRKCHKEKTKKDVGRLAEIKRQKKSEKK